MQIMSGVVNSSSMLSLAICLVFIFLTYIIPWSERRIILIIKAKFVGFCLHVTLNKLQLGFQEDDKGNTDQ